MDTAMPIKTSRRCRTACRSRRVRVRVCLAVLAAAALVGLSACGSGENIPEGASSVLDDIRTSTLPEGGGGIGDGTRPDQPPAAEPPPAEEPPAAEQPAAEAGGEPASEADDGGVDPWVWAVIGVAVVAAIALVVALTRRRKGGPEPRSLVERQQILVAALGGWMAQGWVVESQGTAEAILAHGAERRRFWVDENGVLLQEALQPGGPPATGASGASAPPEPPGPGPEGPDEPPVTPPPR
jgi:hypothetical protein